MFIDKAKWLLSLFLSATLLLAFPVSPVAQRTQKPVLHGKHWMAITGKPLAARRIVRRLSERTTIRGLSTRAQSSVEAADEEGWVVSVTPSGGWIPAVIAGRTGVGLSQRAQSFVTDPSESPFNVIEPGKRPRVTLTPTLALKERKPFLAFAVQGGDSQEQNL